MGLNNATWSAAKDSIKWQLGISVEIVSQTDYQAVIEVSYGLKTLDAQDHSFSDVWAYVRKTNDPDSLDLMNYYCTLSDHWSKWVDTPKNSYCTIGTKRVTVDKTSSAQTISYTAWIRLNGTSGTTATVSRAVVVPAWPVYKIDAPIFVTWEGTSETSKTVVWGGLDLSDKLRPVDSVRIERRTLGNDYVLLATVSPSVERYVDSTLQPNNLYQYRVCGVNKYGNGNYEYSPEVYNTPAAPSGFSAVRLSEETLRISVTSNAYISYSFEAERQKKGESSWDYVGNFSNMSGFNDARAVFTFEDSPGDGQFRYRVRSYFSVDTGGTVLTKYSNWSNPSEYFAASCPPNARLWQPARCDRANHP